MSGGLTMLERCLPRGPWTTKRGSSVGTLGSGGRGGHASPNHSVVPVGRPCAAGQPDVAEKQGADADTAQFDFQSPHDQRQLKWASQEDRAGFVQKVYGILSVQLLLTVLIALPLQGMSKAAIRANLWILILATVILFLTLCCMCCNRNIMRTFPYNYALLFVITTCLGVSVGFSSAQFTWQSVILAAGITTAVFLGLTIYAWTTKTDWTGLGPYLFAGLLILLIFGLAITILAMCGVRISWLIMLYDLAGVLLFTFYIVFDTQMIIGGHHKNQFEIDDYAHAALELYLDIINLFLHLLRLFGERK